MNCYHVDLHVHTTASSDGRSTLEQQISAARKAGLHAIAVTDHNCCTPVPQEADEFLLIPGCEISAQCGHILGLFLERPIDFDSLGRCRAVKRQLLLSARAVVLLCLRIRFRIR